jgi:hypothetical protein
MNLADHQRKLLSLFRCSYEESEADDVYIRRVAQSKDLEEARKNIFMWRVYVLERTCILTFTLLKRRNLLEAALSAFIAGHNISPFRETQAPAFLEVLGAHPDSLVASVARFELALMKVRLGDPNSYEIPWNVEPHALLNSLARDTPLDEEPREGSYVVCVSSDLPAQFEIACRHASAVA